jgi:Mor family transcriptional regulator
MDNDILHRAIERLRKKIPGITDAAAAALELELLEEFAGETHYIPKSRLVKARRQVIVMETRRRFNGRNATEIARELGIGRATVYRIIKTPG